MNAMVEATPKLVDLKLPEIAVISKQLHSLLRHITKSGNRQSLMNQLHDFDEKVSNKSENHYFHWGFSGSHMWVKQRGNDTRIMIVYIINEHI